MVEVIVVITWFSYYRYFINHLKYPLPMGESKKYNEDLCEQVSQGKLAVWFNVKCSMDEYSDLVKLLIHVFPNAKKQVSGHYPFFIVNRSNKESWECWETTSIKSKPVSDFFVPQPASTPLHKPKEFFFPPDEGEGWNEGAETFTRQEWWNRWWQFSYKVKILEN